MTLLFSMGMGVMLFMCSPSSWHLEVLCRCTVGDVGVELGHNSSRYRNLERGRPVVAGACGIIIIEGL